MNIMNLLNSSIQDQLGARVGMSSAQTSTALQTAVPLLLNALSRNASQPQGLQNLNAALNQHRGDTIELFQQGTLPNPVDSQKMLGHIFGTEQTNAVQMIGNRAGIPPQAASQVLNLVAPLVMNAVARQQNQPGQGDLGGLLGNLLTQTGGAAGLLGTLNRALDRDGDGNALNDIMGMLKR